MRDVDGGGVRCFRKGKGGEEGVQVREGAMRIVDQQVRSGIEGQREGGAFDRNDRCGKGCMRGRSERTLMAIVEHGKD